MKDEVIYLRAAGLDLGKRFLVACVRTPAASRAGTWSLETERFETTAAEIRRLLAWLLERRVEVVVLEATSDYWRHLYYTLQPQLNLMLVNPAHLKGIRGRKSDPSDAAFLARAGASGMVMGSFVPRREIRELRDLTRCRTEVITARGREAQRLEKELEDTGMKLSSVISDITGATGRAIINALIQGERDPGTLADLAVRRARSKIPALTEALEGTFTEHHAFMCRHYLDELDHLTAVVEHLDARIAALLARLSRDQDVDRLDTIPGIGRAAAQIIIAETGGDMAQFATAGHLASWIGVCPGMNESAGVNKSGRTRSGNSSLKRILGVAAMAVSRSKDTYLSTYYRRIASRRGSLRALVAVMHKLAIAIWHVLHDKTDYHDLGADYFTRRDPERAMRRMTKEANRLGLTIRFEPIEAT
ncbi:IS110 family transposase [Streptomyces europaeiscabiei]|uniref:IS110 family transposase n=1 Tax=Streptomyces TaxID=1883 RepID=UPI000A3962D6|nr:MULTISPECIES: IS110 family transposase [Streptomyces]MDX3620033.1 IS110 family transposase [Streptomyces europaeiscabiei]MDX3636942.1 IS110 family transposase [Streptomyces europaeiscabiei]MDX3652834.1 IS110 family transposase [Streptomyces europaeiscabiei]WUD38188.1 IS110 family transposase [Streptomyces europaeiscabiei]